jgi:trk/ktr system potassium uptake protein
MIPISTNGISLGFVDALFTATSATCVTGLTVVDTGLKFTLFGQVVILLLIQFGGFGIMTLSTFILLALGRSASFRLSDSVNSQFLATRDYSFSPMLVLSVIFTLVFEIVGACLLFSQWVGEYPVKTAVWFAVFHSVSSFYNAGFSLFPDSLIKYAGNPLVNVSVMALIILGGIGFIVIIDLLGAVHRKFNRPRHWMSFHSKVVLAITFMLILGGSLLFFLSSETITWPVCPI